MKKRKEFSILYFDGNGLDQWVISDELCTVAGRKEWTQAGRGWVGVCEPGSLSDLSDGGSARHIRLQHVATSQHIQLVMTVASSKRETLSQYSLSITSMKKKYRKKFWPSLQPFLSVLQFQQHLNYEFKPVNSCLQNVWIGFFYISVASKIINTLIDCSCHGIIIWGNFCTSCIL